MDYVLTVRAKIFLLFISLIICIESSAQQWQKGNGIYGGNITSFAVNGSKTFASTYGGGIFLSQDDGASWAPVNNGLYNLYVNALTFAGNTLFAGTWNSGVFRSDDMGATWRQVSQQGLTDYTITSLTAVGNSLYAGGYFGGVFSLDVSGAFWLPINSGLPEKYITCLTSYGGNLFAGTLSSGAFVSTNGGTSWTAANDGFLDMSVRCMTTSSGNLYASNDSKMYLWNSSTSTWLSISTGLPTSSSINRLGASNSNLFISGYSGIYKSTNNGASWTSDGNGIPKIFVSAIGWAGSNVLMGTEAGGVYISSNNGTTWSQSNTGMTAAPVLAIAEDGNYLFAGTVGSGVYRSQDGGANWTSSSVGIDRLQISSLIVKGTKLFAGTGTGVNHPFTPTAGGAVYVSNDNADSWTKMTNGLPDYIGEDISSFAIIGSDLFVGTTGLGVYRSSDDGGTWASAGLSSIEITALAVINDTLFAATLGAGVFSSADHGTTWVSVNSGLPEMLSFSLAVDGNNLYVGTFSQGIYRSADFGSTWTQIKLPITYQAVLSMAIRNGYLVVLIQNGGTFVSSDHGTTWCQLTLNDTFYEGVGAITITNNGSFLVGTGNGIYSNKILTVTPVAKPVTNITANGFTANWSKSPNATSYLFDYSSDNFVTQTELNVNDTTKSITGLESNVYYKIRIRSVNTCLTSDYSNIVSFQTLLPSPQAKGATAIAANGFTVNWSNVLNASSYTVDVSTDNFNNFVSGLDSKSVTDTLLNVTGLSSGTTYQYRVRSVNSVGTPSANSNIISTLTIPAAPIAKEITSQANSSFVVSWKKVKGASSYILDVSQDNFTSFVAGFNSLQLTDSSKQVPFTSAGVYQFRVHATNASGASGYSNVVTLTIAGVFENTAAVSLYPNPSSEYIFVEGVSNTISSYLVTNSIGQQIAIELEHDGNRFRSDIRSLNNGLYILEMQTPSGISRVKFIKN